MPQHQRSTEADVDPMFPGRWSPRAFSSKPVPDGVLRSLFEAARWSPSASNQQPWFFLYAATPEHRAIFQPLLVPANRVWADVAPVLAFLLARRNDEKNRSNRLYAFDTGAAWMSVAFQARKVGLVTHAMAGFLLQDSYKTLNVDPAEYEVMCAIAIGYYGDPANLPPQYQEREYPSPRKSLAQVAQAGPFTPANK